MTTSSLHMLRAARMWKGPGARVHAQPVAMPHMWPSGTSPCPDNPTMVMMAMLPSHGGGRILLKP